MASNPAERRQSIRIQHELPVAYRSVGGFLSDWATDISRGGLFINTRRPLPVGTPVRILLQLPDGQLPVAIEGRVARVSEPGNAVNAAPGMGVEFTDLDGPKREELESWVERLRQALEPD